MQHVVPVQAHLIRTVIIFIQVSVAFFSQQVAAYIQVVIVLKQKRQRLRQRLQTIE